MSAPNFKRPLEPVTVTEGEEAKFEVEFVGDPMPVAKWYRYSFPINSNDDIKIVTENGRSTLTVLKACPDDTGIFSCIVENIAGASKSSTNLNVVEAGQEYVLQASTRTTRRLQEMTVSAGDNIRFDIQVPMLLKTFFVVTDKEEK
jgi:Immunoglobulin I-set domain